MPSEVGPWALFRLLDKTTRTKSGPAVRVRFAVEGREALYEINMTSSLRPNPFDLLDALHNFRCPTAAR